jgi:hypothetical protein
LSAPDNPCMTFVMKNITGPIYLTIAALVRSTGVSYALPTGG